MQTLVVPLWVERLKHDKARGFIVFTSIDTQFVCDLFNALSLSLKNPEKKSLFYIKNYFLFSTYSIQQELHGLFMIQKLVYSRGKTKC